MIKLHNTLTKRKEEFIPQLPDKKVSMYTCGVTVYDDCHIGHARSLYIFDTLRRYFKFRGYNVKFIRNITDIDDKIIARANELKVSWKELADKYISAYYQDLEALNISRADCEPRATEHIFDMIVFIESLIDRELAYVTNTGVYFNVRKFVEYGKLSGQSVDQMLSGVRKESDETKSDPLDFALWKRSKENEPFWNSPWGNGRPGWHIECSVMSMKYLGQTMDIHAGGRDLVFPHHENEIAQSQSLTGKPFANYWIHHGLLTINGQKMSKSLGNFITIKEVLKKYPPEVLKILYLQTHYSHPVDFSWEKMEEARKAYERIDIVVDKIEKCLQSDSDKYSKPGVSDFQKQFMDSMDDDFNMPKGLAVLFAVVSAANKILEEGAGEDKTSLSCALADIRLISSVYGLMFSVDKPTNICDDEIIAQINQRLEYKKAKDFIAADTIRKNLEAKGIILEDTREGTTWRRKI